MGPRDGVENRRHVQGTTRAAWCDSLSIATIATGHFILRARNATGQPVHGVIVITQRHLGEKGLWERAEGIATEALQHASQELVIQRVMPDGLEGYPSPVDTTAYPDGYVLWFPST